MRGLQRKSMLVLEALAFVWSIHAFALECSFRRTRYSPTKEHRLMDHQKSALSSTIHDDNEEALSRARNEARTDVRNLLTQRSIQSFMFLSAECRDPHSNKWIEEFLQTRNSLEYHGTAAAYMEQFGGTWDAPLRQMMEQGKDVIIVSAKRRGRGHGGWSKDNPYLEERFVEFEIDIDPVSLANRILSVRTQISQEWVKDLDTCNAANQQILESYFSNVRCDRDTADDQISDDEVVSTAFTRTAVNLLNNNTAFSGSASSPFRKGNFDLLYNLCTQESVHRLLRSMAGITAKEVSFCWMRQFYLARVADYFDGDQAYGRADDFIQELLNTSPSIIYREDGKVGLADPLGIAEQIISERSKVIEDWKEIMLDTPAAHSQLQKLLLEKQMKTWGSSPLSGFE